MEKLQQLKSAILADAKREQANLPLADVEALKSALVEWLAEVRLPHDSEKKSWDETIRVIPPDPNEEEQTGVKVRLALRLCTHRNLYLISIMESLDSDSRGICMISLYVNWTADERQKQKMIEEGYFDGFDDVLRARHSLWAQTFLPEELADALNHCAIAILSHELTARPDQVVEQEPVTHVVPVTCDFPEPD